MRLAFDSLALLQKLGDWTDPVGQRIGLAFNAGTPEAVDRTYGAVISAGFQGATEPWDAFWGQRYAQVLDPDGDKVDIYAPL